MNNLEKALQDIGVNLDGYESSNSFICDIASSDEYSKYYTIMSNRSDYEYIPELSMLNENNNVMFYEGSNCNIKILANFDEDLYRIIAEEK